MHNLFGLAFILLATFPQTNEVDEHLEKYDNIEYSHEYGEFYRSLFSICKADDFSRLKIHANDSIATQAAWETVALTVPEEGGSKVYRPDKNNLNWFIGFFEGRNQISIPNRWKTVVIDARANRRNNIYPGEPKDRPFHRTEIEGVTCPVTASVTEKKRVVTYTEGTNSIVIPEKLLDRADSGDLWCNISCAFTDKKCFVAIHGDVGYSHAVACIDRKTKDVDWESKACGCWWGGASGQHESWVTLVPTEDGRVFCFGSASIGFYAHAFDSSNGKTLLQFSNTY